jgi:rRNA maturation endonuclease Nob1
MKICKTCDKEYDDTHTICKRCGSLLVFKEENIWNIEDDEE